MRKELAAVAMACVLSIPVLADEASEGAFHHRIYTAENITAMRLNAEDSPVWKKRYASTIAKADKLVSLPLDKWNDMIPPPEIPRAFSVHTNGCPVCGDAIYSFGAYPWIITRDKPFKVQCPKCKNFFPDNDYYGYMKSGFKDKSKLAGKYSDDGWGWKNGKDKHKYWFVAYYNHWMFMNQTIKDLETLQTAYILTGKAEYARMCAYLLWRFAGFWSRYDYMTQSRNALEFEPNYTGRMLYHTWESISLSDYTIAFDGILPYFFQPDAELEKLTGKTTDEVRDDIEEKLFRQAILDVWNRRIYGNFGMDQKALIRLAALLKDKPGKPSSEEVVRRLCRLGKWSAEGETPLDYMFFNLLSTDGVPLESPSYNASWIETLVATFHELEATGKDYFKDNIRLQLLLLHFNRMMIGRQNFQSLGDSGRYTALPMYCEAYSNWIGFQHYKLPGLAAAMTFASPNFDVTQSGVRPDKKELQAAWDQLDPLYFNRSDHMPGYGYLTIQNGNPEKPAGIAMNYRFFPGHYHCGLLHFELFSRGRALTPDFGYPDTASGNDPRRFGWFRNTLAHNTVVVNGRVQNSSPEVFCKAYDTGDFAEYVEIDAPSLYNVKTYGRSLVTVKVDDERMIVVDFFRVDGGQQHDYFFHGNTPDISAELPMKKQVKGTLAGPDVPFEKFYDDPRFRDAVPGTVMYWDYQGSGFQFLTEVSRGEMKNSTRVHMAGGNVKEGDETVSVGVDFYNLPEGKETLFLSQGPLQKYNKNPSHVGFMTRRRTGKDLRSNFVSVIDFGTQPGVVEKVEALEHSFERAAVQITLKDGRRIIVFNNLDGFGKKTLAVGAYKLEGKTGALELDKDGVRRMWLYGEGKIADGEKTLLAARPYFQAKVVGVDILKGKVAMETMAPWCRTENGENRWAFDGFRAYRIKVQDKTIDLYPELPVRGMFKLKSWNSETKTAEMEPRPQNLHRNLYLIAPDGKETIGPVEVAWKTIRLTDPEAQLPDEKDTIADREFEASDYFLSEIGAGTKLTIPDSARWFRDKQ